MLTERERERVAEAKALAWAASSMLSQARALASGHIPEIVRSGLGAAQKALSDFELAMQSALTEKTKEAPKGVKRTHGHGT